jgi:hypothetical protein
MNINDLEKETKLFALFVGRSNSGKTCAALSLPRPLHEIDTDVRANGVISAIQQGWISPNDVDIKRFDAFKGFIPIQEHLNLLQIFVQTNQFRFQSIDWGSLGSLHRLLIITSLAINAKGSGIGHINLAGLNMTGYGDYRFETQALFSIIDHLRMLPCNITMSAHIQNKYGKKAGAKETDPNVILGERLVLTENLAESVLGMFNDVYKFSKEMVNSEDHYFVEFNTEIARNTYGIPPGRFDITRKNFWNFFQELVKDIREGKDIKPKQEQKQEGNFLQL